MRPFQASSSWLAEHQQQPGAFFVEDERRTSLCPPCIWLNCKYIVFTQTWKSSVFDRQDKVCLC